MDTLDLQNRFLALMAFVYLCAFASLYHQIPGLYGNNGILPVAHKMKCDYKNPADCLFIGNTPTVVHFLTKILPSLGAEGCLEIAVLFGMILSSVVTIFKPFRDCMAFVLLWAIYYACVQNLETFLWFQWDTLLLEIGFLAILVAPFKPARALFKQAQLPSDCVTVWLVLWLAFRLMFASGVVKLTSECPTWWGLTALHWHFESQCIPTPAAWHAHIYSPDWLKALSVAGTYLIEVPVVLWFFSPVRHVRVAAFWLQAFLMVVIMVTGNYNFFNITYQLACLPLLIDDSRFKFTPTKFVRKMVGARLFWLLRLAFIGCVYGSTAYWFIRLFNIRLDYGRDLAETKILSSIAFSKHEFNSALEWWVPAMMICATVLFVGQLLLAYVRCFTEYKGRLQKLKAVVGTSLNCFICSLLFAISLVPFSTLVPGGHEKFITPHVKALYNQADGLQLVHSYGLFRRMTGVGGRPEVVIEGSLDSHEGPWLEYEFKYKPTDLARRPPFIVPHQARLDWQMWFAALGDYRHNPWFLATLHRLLVNQSEVLDLMAKQPFGSRTPKFVRALRYTYHFAEPNASGQWWTRENPEIYCPPFSLEHKDVLDYMRQAGLLPYELAPAPPIHPIESWLKALLASARSFAAACEPEVFVWTVCLTVVLAAVIKARLMRP